MSCEASIIQTRQEGEAQEGEALSDLRQDLARLHGEAWAWAVSCCRGDRQRAHDVLHDAYVQILVGRAAFEARSTFKTWVFGVIRVVAMAARRRRLVLDFVFEPIGPRAESVAAPEMPRSAPPRLVRAIAALPRRQSEIVTLVYAHDMTIEEAAAVMNVSLGAARQHHARAKQKLRAAVNLENDYE
jgi:RNA polymerase sigma-70 factor (ECF subfamily)